MTKIIQNKKKILRPLIFVLLNLFVFSQEINPQLPSVEPLFLAQDIGIEADNTGPVLSADDVFKLSLRFSECEYDSQEWAFCVEQFESLKKKVSSQDFMNLEQAERGRAILKLIYQDYLKTYNFNQTKINVALQEGVYNCVSSALLYMAVAKAAGLDVRGQKTSEHAFCTVYIPGSKAGQVQKIDVETTNPYGFNPGSKEAIENEDKIQGYYIVPKKYYSNRQEVSDRIFTGLIAQNICAAYILQDDYEKAVPLGAARYELVRLEQSKSVSQVRRDFDVIASNYVNVECESAQAFLPILDWFTLFIDRWQMTDYLQKNMDNAFNNLMVYCFNEKNYELAAEAYEKDKVYLTKNQDAKTADLLTDILVTSKISDEPAETQIAVIEQLLNETEFEPDQEKRVLIYLENAWLSILNTCMTERTYGTGYQKACDALERLPDSTKIKKMQKSFYDNCIAIIHNNFAKQANAGYFDDARKILEAGMQVFPDDKTLKNDLVTLERMMK